MRSLLLLSITMSWVILALILVKYKPMAVPSFVFWLKDMEDKTRIEWGWTFVSCLSTLFRQLSRFNCTNQGCSSKNSMQQNFKTRGLKISYTKVWKMMIHLTLGWYSSIHYFFMNTSSMIKVKTQINLINLTKFRMESKSKCLWN